MTGVLLFDYPKTQKPAYAGFWHIGTGSSYLAIARPSFDGGRLLAPA